MSEQNQTQTPNIPPNVRGYGRWEGLDKAISDITAAYKTWRDWRPPPADRRYTWYCPICTETEYYSGTKRIPRCPRHHDVEMSRYDEEEFSRRRRELAEAAIRDIPKVVAMFAKAVEIYSGRPPEEWRFENGVVTVKPDDPTELRYEDGAIHAIFYHCDLDRHCKAAKFLYEEADRLGFPVLAEFYPPHFDGALLPEARYDRSRNAFVVEA
jgi:hypothetical protein